MNQHEFKTFSNFLKGLETKYGPEMYQKTFSNSGIKELLYGVGTPSFYIKPIMTYCRVSRGEYDLKVLLKLLTEVNNTTTLPISPVVSEKPKKNLRVKVQQWRVLPL